MGTHTDCLTSMVDAVTRGATYSLTVRETDTQLER